jgi:hypothetical protein
MTKPIVTPGLSRGSTGRQAWEKKLLLCANLRSGCRDKPGMTVEPDHIGL